MKAAPPLLVRRRLLHRLAGPWRVAVVAAPAGYGKTTFARQAVAGRDALWLRLGPDDRALGHLVGSLLGAGIAHRPPRLVRAQRLFASRRDLERDLGLVTASLAAELRPARGERRLVLDDLHELEGAGPALAWLARLLDAAGPRVRAIVTCRGACPLALGRFEATGGVQWFEASDLAFTAGEERTWLARALGARRAQDEAGPLRETFGGWPAGLALAVRRLREGAPFAASAAGDGAEHGGPTHRFLADEVIAPLPSWLRRSLALAASLDDLDEGALGALLGAESARRTLAEIRRRDLFARPESPGLVERFHPLFRDHLRSHAAASLPAADRRRRLLRVAHWWLERGQPARAVRAFAAAGADAEAVRVIERASRGGREHTLGALASDLARDTGAGARSPWVHLALVNEARSAGDAATALAHAIVAVDALAARGDELETARAFGLESWLAIGCGAAAASARRAGRLLARLRGRRARGVVMLAEGRLWLYAGAPSRARACLERAGRELPRGASAIDRAELAMARASVEYAAGRWETYLRVAPAALAIYRRTGHWLRAYHAMLNLAEAHTYLGDESAALARLDEAAAVEARAEPRPEQRALRWLGRARALADRGESAAAGEALDRAREVAGPGAAMTLAMADAFDGVRLRRQGRAAAARARLAAACDRFRPLSPAWFNWAAMERALADGLSGSAAAPLAVLRRASRTSARLGDPREAARVALYEARVLQQAGRPHAAALTRALRGLQRLDWLVLLRKERDVAAPLLTPAAASGVPPALVAAARASLGEVPHADRAASATRNARRRARTAGAPALHEVRVLGSVSWRIGGREVRIERRSARALLVLLVLRRDAPAHREALAETLWPEAPPAASRNRFDVALNALRRAVEPQAGSRGPFEVIVSEGGIVRLVRGAAQVDLDAFDRDASACEPAIARLDAAPWDETMPLSRAEVGTVLRRLEASLAQVGGELAADLVDAPWLAAARESLGARRHRLRVAHARLALAAGHHAAALASARSALAGDPLAEDAARIELQALVARGALTEARRRHLEFVSALERELGVAPAPETVTLAQRLLGVAASPLTAPASAPSGPSRRPA